MKLPAADLGSGPSQTVPVHFSPSISLSDEELCLHGLRPADRRSLAFNFDVSVSGVTCCSDQIQFRLQLQDSIVFTGKRFLRSEDVYVYVIKITTKHSLYMRMAFGSCLSVGYSFSLLPIHCSWSINYQCEVKP